MITKRYSLIYFALALFCLGNPAAAQRVPAAKVKKTVTADKIPLDEAVKTGRLANGFTYYIRKNSEPKNRVQLYLAVKTGSILETDKQQGLAHFMEHMSFNGTKNYPKNELISYLQKAGVRFGADLNAYTSFDETVYQLPIPSNDPEVLKNGLQIMRDWAQDALLEADEIDKERGIILEEKRLGKGSQERMQNKYLPVLFNGSRYAQRLPIGTDEVLKTFKHEEIKQFYKDWYRPDLQALIVVGDIDAAAMEKEIKARFSDLKSPAKPLPRVKYSIPLLNKNQFIAVTDKEMPVTVMQVLIKHPESKLETASDMRLHMVKSLYNSMMGERLSDLKKQANPPFLQAGSGIEGFLAGLDAATSVFVAKPGEIERGFKALYTELERARKFGFTASELERAKRSYLSSMESAYNERGKTSSERYVREYLEHFLKGTASPGIAYEYEYAKATVPSIALKDIDMLMKKYLTEVNRDIIIMAPDKDAASLPKEATVNLWISQVKQQKLDAYVDAVSDKPLMAQKPAPGKVVAEKREDKIGLTELTLSNGARVLLKATDFKNDEIMMRAFSPGGSSLYPDADYESASNADDIVSRGGLGEFDSKQLPKMLADKRVSVTPYIGERSEGISMYSAPKDLETALQLVNLYFTQPRKDKELFDAFVQQQKAVLQNRGNDPNSVFSDTITAVLGAYNIRRTGPSVEKIERIDLDRAFAIYKERFADASDFTFTFVGNFDEQKIRPLIEQYIGSLPSLKRNEKAADLGISVPRGKLKKVVKKGQEDKATVRMVFTGDYVYNRENNNQIDALGEILQFKLTERLREEESGVYSPGVRAGYTKLPRNKYTFTVAFGCSPANVDKLINATFDEINKLKTAGPSTVDIGKFLAEERLTTETQLKQNGFWLNYVSGQYEQNESALEVLSYLESLKKLNAAGLKQATTKYLSGDDVITFILLPETVK